MSVTSAKIDRLSAVTQDALKTGSIEFRRSYLRMFVGRATVSRREVRISGPKAALAKAASSDVPAPGPGVLSFIREWRPVRDSNPRCRRERAVSWASRRRGPSARPRVLGQPAAQVQAGSRRCAARSARQQSPVRGSTSSTRSAPPPCNCTASRSPADAIAAIRVPAGSSSSTAIETGGPTPTANPARDHHHQHRRRHHDQHAHDDGQHLQESHAGPRRFPASTNRVIRCLHARPRATRSAVHHRRRTGGARPAARSLPGRCHRHAVALARQVADRAGHAPRATAACSANRPSRSGPAPPTSSTCRAPVPATPQPQAIPFTILYEDADLIVLDKPAGLVVHPAPGNQDGTLVNALLAHCGDSSPASAASAGPASCTGWTRTPPASWWSPRPSWPTPR